MTRGRGAQQFHELVEDGPTRGARPPEYAALLDLVGALRAVPPAVADPAFVATLREQLIAEAETVLAAAAAERDDADAKLRLPTATPRASSTSAISRSRSASVSSLEAAYSRSSPLGPLVGSVTGSPVIAR